MGAKVWEAKHEGKPSHWIFNCPACRYPHVFDERWTFNGNVEKPTFGPSLLVYGHGTRPRCHSFVVDGQIRFCADSTHEMKGKNVDLEDFSWEKGD